MQAIGDKDGSEAFPYSALRPDLPLCHLQNLESLDFEARQECITHNTAGRMSGDTGANAMEDTPVVLAGPSAGEDPAVALAQSLDKIRHQTTSNLVHQKRPATLLLAIEATLTEESETALTPVAYFAALLSTLEQIASLPADQQQVADPEGETLAAVLYLLAMVLPYTPASIIRTRTSSLLEVLAPLLATLKESAPAIKSLFAIFATLFLSLDNATLTSSLHYKQIYNTLLSFLVDGRPKVRRKAQEVVTSLLANPPAPSTKHPYANRTAEFVLESLKESLREGKKGGKRKQQAEGTPSDEATRAIALCAFIKSIGKDWPATVSICGVLFPRCLLIGLHSFRLLHRYALYCFLCLACRMHSSPTLLTTSSRLCSANRPTLSRRVKLRRR